VKQLDERGAMGGIEGFAFGVLIFAFGTLMIINAWAVVDGKMTASAAAREATRSFVEAPNQQAAMQAADAAARRVTKAKVNTTLEISPLAGGTDFGRCQEVTANVRIAVPRVSLPLIGGTGGTFPVTASHTEVIDPYRSTLAANAACP
jgi:hypothetical protein